MQALELSDMLVMLRQELKAAQDKAEAEQEDLRFKVEDVEVEVNFTIGKEVSGKSKGKFKFWVFAEAELEAGGKYASQKVHKVKLRLTPQQEKTLKNKSLIPIIRIALPGMATTTVLTWWC